MTQTKVILITIPSSSHINPILPIVTNLIESFNFKFIVYSTITYKPQIEKTGAEFRPFFMPNANNCDLNRAFDAASKPKHRTSKLAPFLTELIEIAENNILALAKDIHKEKPDLILHESTALHAILTLRLLNENYNLVAKFDADYQSNGRGAVQASANKIPVMYFSTKFLHEKNVYPNDDEHQFSNTFVVGELIKMSIDKEFLILRTKTLSEKYGLAYKDPFEEAFNADPKILNLILIIPEIHPKVYLYHRNNKFIGTILSENPTANELADYNTNLIIKYILQEYQPLSATIRTTLINDYNSKFLIHVSLKNKFSENLDVYLKLFDVFNDRNFARFTILISLGRKGCDDFEKLLKDNQVQLSNNIMIATNVPRLEILKRTSIFITNCDMVSVNEALFCGVPMLCLPITSDQMLVSHRITTELGLGIYLDYVNLECNHITSAINELSNECTSYKNKCMDYSRLYKEYDAKAKATKYIIDYINSNKNNTLNLQEII